MRATHVNGVEDGSPLLGRSNAPHSGADGVGKRKTSEDEIEEPHSNLDQVIETLGFGRFQRQLFFLCGMGHFVDAVEIALMSLLFPILKSQWLINNTDLALLAAATNAGMIIGSLGLGALSDTIGRRPIFQLSLALSSVCGFLSALAPSFGLFVFLRFLLGIGYGGNIVVDITLFTEFLPIKNRGVFLALIHTFFGIGNMFIVLVAWIVVPTLGWRWLVGISAVPAFIMLFARAGIPETPRFLLMNGQHDAARDVMVKVAITNGWNEHQVDHLRQMHLDLNPNNSGQSTRLESWDSIKHLAKKPLIGLLVPLSLTWLFNSSAGTLFHWIPMHLAESHGATIDHAFQSALLLGLGDVLGSLLMAGVIECSGRLVMLRGSLFLLAGLVFALSTVTDLNVIFALLPVIYAFKSAAMDLLYTYTPEAFPTPVRSTGFGICSSMHRFAPTITPFLIAALLEKSFALVCVVFGGFYLIAAAIALLLPVETHNRKIRDKLHHE